MMAIRFVLGLTGVTLMAATVGPATTPPPAHPAEKEAAKAAPPGGDEGPPSVTPNALQNEMKQAQVKATEMTERQQIAEERAKLEKMANDIAQARTALQSETARLEQLVKEADGRSIKPPATSPPPVATKPATKPPDPPESYRADVVVKALRGLKPEQAALVIKKLSRPLAARVLAHMRTGDSAAVISKLEPAEAAELLTDAAKAE
jgi:flagellar motility protein MotE (MotC chaperone)